MPEYATPEDQLAAIATRIERARAAGDADAEARAHFDEAALHSGMGRDGAALICCERAVSIPGASASVRALAISLREGLSERPDIDLARSAAETLTEAGDWEHAGYAWSRVARMAGTSDIAAARRACVSAVGCYEAGGAQRLGAGALRQLATLEIRAGDPRRALAPLDQALRRLDGVLLLGARLEEALCVEALGDALAALGDPRAPEQWRDALERQQRLQRPQAIEALQEKLAAWEKRC